MIREATLSDIPAMLEIGERFSAKAKLAEHVGYDATDMEATFRAMIENENYVIFVNEGGLIGGAKAPHPFNYSHWIAQEMFWWAERDGLKLLHAFEEWAREHCHSIRMIAVEAIQPERVGRIYERQGYVPLEHGYIKVF